MKATNMQREKRPRGPELRTSPRRHVSQPALIVRPDGSTIGECTMLDVSAGGAKLKLDGELSLPPEFTLQLSKLNPAMRRHCTVAWSNQMHVGVQFLPDLE